MSPAFPQSGIVVDPRIVNIGTRPGTYTTSAYDYSLNIFRSDTDKVGIRLYNTDAINDENSPWILWQAGGTSNYQVRAYADPTGALQLRSSETLVGSASKLFQFFGTYSGAGIGARATNRWNLGSLTGAVTGLEVNQTFLGSNASSSDELSGIFAINRYGESGSGGSTNATAIAVGGYNEFRGSSTQTTSPSIGGEFASTVYNTATVFAGFGASNYCQVESGGVGTFTTCTGIYGESRIQTGGTGTFSKGVGISGVASMHGSGTMTNGVGGEFSVADDGAGSIATATGVNVTAVTAGGTNNYGVRIAGASGGSTNNVALQVDSGETRFKDSSAVFQVKSVGSYFGPGTAVDTCLTLDSATSPDARLCWYNAGSGLEMDFDNTLGNGILFTSGGMTVPASRGVIATAGTVRIPNGTSLPGTCTTGDEYQVTNATSGQQKYNCEGAVDALGTWKLQGDGGGSVAFSAISGGANTLATMLVGSGASLNATGTGVIAATTVPGTGVSGNITGTSANVSGTVASDHGGTGFTTYTQGDVIYASATNTLAKLAKDASANRYMSNTGTLNGPAWAQIDLGVAGSFSNALLATKGGTGLTIGTSGGVNYWSTTSTMASSALLASNGIVVGGGAGTAPFTSAATATVQGSIALPTAQTVDIAAHATDGGSLVLKEGADDGSNTFTLKVPDAGLTASKTVTLVAATGNLPASSIEDSGTVSKCAHFDASGILVAASGDCATGGGGSGTVTGVGPGCTTGLCYTNATVTAGTVFSVWEGTTSDANQWNINVPADPTAVINWTVPDATTALTFPSGTDTLIGKATTDTLTNKTLNVESTGNVLTTVEKLWLPAAGCNNATAATFWDLPTANAPTPTCVTGSNTQKGVLAFPDSDGAYSAQQTLLLPSDWTGTMDAKIKWMSAITTGDVFWQVSTICVADAETDDPAFNTASTVADTAKGTTLQTNDAAITTVTVTGCAAGELMHLKIMRDRTNGSDTLGASSAQLIGVELTLRRAQ